MHLLDYGIHPGQGGLRRGHDHVHAFAENIQFAVGDQAGDLQQEIGGGVEPGHLTVDPDEAIHIWLTLGSPGRDVTRGPALCQAWVARRGLPVAP